VFLPSLLGNLHEEGDAQAGGGHRAERESTHTPYAPPVTSSYKDEEVPAVYGTFVKPMPESIDLISPDLISTDVIPNDTPSSESRPATVGAEETHNTMVSNELD
jgi:hypothetical protein